MKTKANYSVYCYRHFDNKKPYIGQTMDVPRRKTNHTKAKTDTHFHSAVRLYGIQAFIFSVLKDGLTKPLADFWEKYYIQEFDAIANGYNMTEGGEYFPTGDNHPMKRPEVAARKADSMRGDKNPSKRKEVREKISKSLMGNQHAKGKNLGNKNALGSKHSEEVKEAKRKAMLGKQYALGYKHTEETKQRLSKANMGNQNARKHNNNQLELF